MYQAGKIHEILAEYQSQMAKVFLLTIDSKEHRAIAVHGS